MRIMLSLVVWMALLAPGSARAGVATVDFNRSVKPILERNCVRCHSGDAPKAGLKLDTREDLMKGTKNGPVVVIGKADQSKLIKMVSLPAADPSRMPAQGDPLSRPQINTLRAWINQGVRWPDGVKLTVQAPTAQAPALSASEAGTPSTPAETDAINKLTQAGVHVMRLAQNVHWLRVDFALRGTTVRAGELVLLGKMPNVVELNLGGTDLGDSALAQVKALPNLERLQLHRTKVTDAGLAQLRGLKKLASINLYGTAVTDAGLAQLEPVKTLRNVYLWESKVTEAGAKTLANAIPGVTVNIGHDVRGEKK